MIAIPGKISLPKVIHYQQSFNVQLLAVASLKNGRMVSLYLPQRLAH